MVSTPRNPVQITSQDEIGTALGRLRMTAFVENGPAVLPRPRRVLDSYALVLVHEGTGTYLDDTVAERPIGPGDAILVTPGTPHWYGPPPGQGWSEIFLIFDGPLFDTLAAGGVLDARDPIRSLRPAGPWRQRLRTFASRPRETGELQRRIELLELATLLAELRGAHGDPDPLPQPLRRARDLLAVDLSAEHDLRAVAAAAGLPYETFRKRFRAATGRSPAAFRLDRRIEAAQSLLRVTTMTHAAIAAGLGFSDECHFAKRFRERVGMSPRDYRRLHASP
ncbi:helix-turn-helix domain-containing protein [Actinomadura sp. 6N118]|uniref:AraC family transcriptional regulator n=1 Tax=Actinomadura sp. 6N118 TaxID=3375151 RepID=UPI00378F0AC1